jgi:hypothetical protein
MDNETQFLLLDLDTTWEAEAELPGHNFYLPPLKPGIWGEEWSEARVYERLVISGKPSNIPLEQWICIWCPRWDKEVGTYDGSFDMRQYPYLRFTADGIYYNEFPPVTHWPGAHARINEHFEPAVEPVTHILLQMFGLFYENDGPFQDHSGRYNILKLRQDHWLDNNSLREHLPFHMRAEICVVKRDASFEVPVHWKDVPQHWNISLEPA